MFGKGGARPTWGKKDAAELAGAATAETPKQIAAEERRQAALAKAAVDRKASAVGLEEDESKENATPNEAPPSGGAAQKEAAPTPVPEEPLVEEKDAEEQPAAAAEEQVEAKAPAAKARMTMPVRPAQNAEGLPADFPSLLALAAANSGDLASLAAPRQCVGDTAATELGVALAGNTRLHSLGLQNNSIGPRGALGLAQAALAGLLELRVCTQVLSEARDKVLEYLICKQGVGVFRAGGDGPCLGAPSQRGGA